MLRGQIVPVVIAGLIGLSGVSFNRVYNGSLLVALVCGAALGSVLVSVVLRRVTAWMVAAVSVAALVAYGILAMGIAAQTSGVAGGLVTLAADAARNAVPRMLTALIPIEAQPDTVLGPVVLAWLAGCAGTELAVRAGRPALGLAPPTLLYAGGLVFVGPNADMVLWHVLAFIGLATVGLAAGGIQAGSRDLAGVGSHVRAALRLRTLTGVVTALLGILTVGFVGSLVVAAAVSRSPADPRRYVRPPSLDVLDLNPLIRISGWAANPEQRLFNVTVLRGVSQPGPAPEWSASLRARTDEALLAEPLEPSVSDEAVPDGDAGHDTRLRLAVLADWDGVTWHADADYRNAGRVLPGRLARPGSGDDSAQPPPLIIQERITVAELQGRLLPAVSAPRRVEGVRVAYDASTGTLLHPERLSPGVWYTVTSVNPSIDVSLLPVAEVPAGPRVARYLAVGDEVPHDLSRLAEQIAAGQGSPYLRALALETFLSEHYRFASDAPSGHAYPNLRFFLFADPRAGGQRGTSEQFAGSFAALGRLLGLPTRVVVGFRTPAGGGTVTGRDALAWPEVLFDGVGWVAFDPMPRPDTPPRPLEDEFLPKPLPPTSPPASVEPEESASWSPPAQPTSIAAAGPSGPGAGTIAGSVAGSLLALWVVLLFLVVLLRAARRRRRLSQGSPPQRVLGAWGEVLDALALAGAAPAAHLAAGEVADHAAAVALSAPGRRHSRRPRPAAPPLRELAAMVNAARFGGAVGQRTVADDSAVVVAKATAIGYATALRARRSWWRRLLWRVDPRPLRRKA